MLSKNAFSQKGYTVMHFTDDNGLPQNSVRSLAADVDGFVWIATENGLARFDGHRFEIFDKSVVGTTSNRFSMLLPSMNATGAGRPGQQRLGGEMYAVTDFNQFVKIENGRASVDPLYFERKIRTLPHFGNSRSGAFLSAGIPGYPKETVVPMHYIIPVGDEKFYLIDSVSVQLYHGKRKLSNTDFAPGELRWWNFFMVGNRLHYRNANGHVLAVTPQGLQAMHIHGDILRDNGYKTALPDMKVFWNMASNQLFFYRQKKLYLVREERNRKFTTELVIDGFDLDEYAIQSVYRDPLTGTCFLGSLSKGLYVLTRHSFEALTTPETEIANVYYAIVPRDDRSVLTPTGTVLGKDPVTGEVLRGKVSALQKLNTSDKRSLFYDKNGLLWAKAANFLYQIDVEQDRMLRKVDLYSEIKHVYPDQDGKIWIATGTEGIYIFDPAERAHNRNCCKRSLKERTCILSAKICW
ncbi:two-component regulator propeller domain-containing protein [Dyadobacter sp. 676]|uniref:Two-component regulator propeller domain-containing protein n=1 Tax=Dyadobacter sp. 676 TaxID=3088362 RepID=A0AAU8FGU8_9BACT